MESSITYICMLGYCIIVQILRVSQILFLNFKPWQISGKNVSKNILNLENINVIVWILNLLPSFLPSPAPNFTEAPTRYRAWTSHYPGECATDYTTGDK